MTPIRSLDIQPAELDSLGRDLIGRLHRPGDDNYAERTTPRNTAGTRSPGAVAVAASPDDVAACVRWARDHGHRVLPQVTGHGFAGLVAADTLLIDTSALNRVDIDGGRAAAGSGAQWGDVSAAAEPHGRLGLAGTAPDTGVDGYTFHGGSAG